MSEKPMLAGRVAIVSGALGDIGAAITRELGARGTSVALGDVQPAENAAPLLDELQNAGIAARYDVVDVSDAGAVAAWVRYVEEAFGVADLIIPNAAIVTLESIRTVTSAQWQRELRINLDGAFHLAQSASLRLLETQQPGRIVFIGSWAAHSPHIHLPAYSVAKAGLRMLMKCLALDLAPHDILVNEVAPGYVNAGLSGRIFEENAGLRAEAEAKVPVRRLISAHEVALEVAHLCDPQTRHTTGSVVLMDGGLSLL
jgi:NAD(P)-dependent dehydrogenase (short-subunit alcohol dehydrogenase family)